ncbi:uncharacterized protein LOC128728988 [Anopheles nili]|uniref:uncharacterized protein LOC128728988 n=1 Tax=Anopheles nili TaxID=185578 RepID=UPI00237C14AF|nr:uncharacterized protein LOC128728988 [Anopheles nili]
MQRHRKKDRTERAAPPTIQKYLQCAVGATSGPPALTTSENLYQPCVGGGAGPTGKGSGAGATCCRKDELLFRGTGGPRTGGCYPEDDPDSIEVYKEQQQQQQQQQGPCDQQHFTGKWCTANVSHFPGETDDTPSSLPPDDVALLPHHQTDQQQQQHLVCHANTLATGSAEYSYAYCEPILLQRPSGEGTGDPPLHTPASTLSSSGSSYCVPVYAQRHPLQQHTPTLPLLQRSFRQPTATRTNPYQYAYGPAGGSTGGPGTTTTLHHHHHHHHHHSNYTLPNTAVPTTTTGSLRALFSNIFRKSSTSTVPSAPTAAHSAPFLDLEGDGTLPRGGIGGHPPTSSLLVAAERHSFTTCYGTKENIYEDIGSQTGLGGLGEEPRPTRDPTGPTPTPAIASTSAAPLPLPPPSAAGSPTGPGAGSSLAAEWRRVQVQHERIIGELNLSVERLIMPSCDDERPHRPEVEQSEGKATPATRTFGHGGQIGGQVGLRASTKRLFPVPTSAASSVSPPPPPPPQTTNPERHSPTISYGKSYGDVDSGISSSSTSGTSYSSSILYRSITNYQPPPLGSLSKDSGPFGGGVPIPGVRPKPTLFGLRSGVGLAAGVRSGSCRGAREAMGTGMGSLTGGSSGVSVSGLVTNAPDPPPPPDADPFPYGCTAPTGPYGPFQRPPYSSASSHTLASCCFLSDHGPGERSFASAASTCGGRGTRTTGGGGTFWARFRKLRLPTGAGGKLFSASDRHIDAELRLEDFAAGGPLWPEPTAPRPAYLPAYQPYHHHHHHHHASPLEGPSHRAVGGSTIATGALQRPPALHLFAAPTEPAAGPLTTELVPEVAGGEREEPGKPSDTPHHSSTPSSPSSAASTPSSGSSSSSVSPSSPTSPVSSSSCSSTTKPGGGGGGT